MSVIVLFGRRKAILYGARWTAADGDLELRLNEETRRWLRETGGPPAGSTDPDYLTAMQLAGAHGGRVYRYVSSQRNLVRDAYARARQLDLFG
jgi:hypothetical protein